MTAPTSDSPRSGSSLCQRQWQCRLESMIQQPIRRGFELMSFVFVPFCSRPKLHLTRQCRPGGTHASSICVATQSPPSAETPRWRADRAPRITAWKPPLSPQHRKKNRLSHTTRGAVMRLYGSFTPALQVADPIHIRRAWRWQRPRNTTPRVPASRLAHSPKSCWRIVVAPAPGAASGGEDNGQPTAACSALQ